MDRTERQAKSALGPVAGNKQAASNLGTKTLGDELDEEKGATSGLGS